VPASLQEEYEIVPIGENLNLSMRQDDDLGASTDPCSRQR